MADKKLPEELLREILSYRFAISPTEFCLEPSFDPIGSRTRPIERGARPCQELLLVSKRWLRVGTPLLYESLAIRTSEHERTVAKLLAENCASRVPVSRG